MGVGARGTFALPEAQLDRFLMRLSLGYPDQDAEEKMLTAGRTGDPFEAVQQVLSLDVLAQLQDAVRAVHVHDEVRRYVVQVVASTRVSKDLAWAPARGPPKGSTASARPTPRCAGATSCSPTTSSGSTRRSSLTG